MYESGLAGEKEEKIAKRCVRRQAICYIHAKPNSIKGHRRISSHLPSCRQYMSVLISARVYWRHESILSAAFDTVRVCRKRLLFLFSRSQMYRGNLFDVVEAVTVCTCNETVYRRGREYVRWPRGTLVRTCSATVFSMWTRHHCPHV